MTKRMQKAVTMAIELQEKHNVSKERAIEIALGYLLERKSKKQDKFVAKSDNNRSSWLYVFENR